MNKMCSWEILKLLDLPQRILVKYRLSLEIQAYSELFECFQCSLPNSVYHFCPALLFQSHLEQILSQSRPLNQ